ncbi:MAG: DMT family transporter [Acidimicrobiales bacterium]
MIVSYGFAILAAVSNAGSNVLQRKANSEEPPERSFSLRLIWDLVHSKAWWLGIGFVTSSFLFQAVALGTGELAAVQPIIVFELPLTMVAGKLFLGSEMHLREWGAIALLTAGLGGLVGFLDPHGGTSSASIVKWLAGAGGTALLIAVAVVAGLKHRGQVRAGLFGAAAGVTFGLTAAFMKSTTGEVSRGLGDLFTSWQPYAMMAAGALGLFLVQNALQAGRLVAAQPGISLLDPFTSIAWGVIVFDERANGGLFLVLAGLSATAMAAGAVLLSSSPVLQRSQQAGSPREDERVSPTPGDP